ncbi:MAG: tetratricopeptide repeat protein [Verrucomicrobiales bacterium]|nr:tetratricopeptide repeat protein [Verrucomicrobiales bacterium]
MKNFASVWRSWFGARGTALVFLSVASLGASAQTSSREAIDRGLAELRGGRLTEARVRFQIAETLARDAGDRDRQAEAVFFRGLADQSEAQAGKLPGDPTHAAGQAGTVRLLRSALASYEEALRLRPDSPGILNNAAQVQLQLGRTNEALALMTRAIGTSDPMRATYTRNYADMLLNAGRWRDACRFYALVAVEQPQNQPLQQKLVDLCMAKGPDLMGLYFWDLAQAGQVVQVSERALAIVDRPVWEPRQAEELMAVVAFCLARQRLVRQDFVNSSMAKRLDDLASHRVVGEGARELLQLIAGAHMDPSQYRWWPARHQVSQEAPRGIWPLEAFQQLARSLADRAAEDKDLGRQEQYLLLSVGLNLEAPDPEALTQLANFYSENNQLGRLDQLMQRYEVDIFRAKGTAYTQTQLKRIYRYHMALGVIYSHLNRWTSPRVVDSATFQLDRALQVADRLKEEGNDKGLAAVTVPVGLVDLLARAYEKDGRIDQAVGLRLDRAEKFLEAGNRQSAAEVVRPLDAVLRPDPAGVNNPSHSRFLKIQSRLSEPSVPLGGVAGASAEIHVAAQAEGIAGNRGWQSLTEADRKAVESAARSALSTLGTGTAQSSPKVQAYRTLSTNVAPEIQEVSVSGEQGQAVVRRGTNLIRVPFKVEQAPATPGNKARWVRP